MQNRVHNENQKKANHERGGNLMGFRKGERDIGGWIY